MWCQVIGVCVTLGRGGTLEVVSTMSVYIIITQVQELVKDMNIQLSNKCQFLPQVWGWGCEYIY